MADKTDSAPAGGDAKPAVRGVTLAERNARSAQERDLSAANESAMPTMADIAGYLPGARAVVEGKSKTAEATRKAGTQPQQIDSNAEADVDPNADPNADVDVDPNADPNADADVDPNADPNADADVDPNADPNADADVDPNADPNADPDGAQKGWPKSAQARVNELTREKHEARERLTTVETELTQLRERLGAAPVRIAPTPQNPLAHTMNEADIAAEITRAQSIEEWALRNPEGVDVVKNPQTGETEFVSAETVREHLAAARRVMNAAPARREYLALHQDASMEAHRDYPNVFKPGTEEAQVYSNTLQAFPEIMRLPNFPLIIADAIEGQKARKARHDALKKKAPVPIKKPGVAPITAKPAPRAPAKMVVSASARSAVVKSSGDRRSLARFAETLI